MFQYPSTPLSIRADVLGSFLGFPITNTETTAILDFVIIILLCLLATGFRTSNPSNIQVFIEYVLDFITGMIEQVVGNKKLAWKIMPIVATLIIFLIISNLITTIFFFLGLFTYNGVALFRTHTNDYNTTFALAFSMIFLVQIYSIQTSNPLGYLLRFIRIGEVINGFKKGISQGLLSFVDLFIGLLDMVSEIAKIVSLSLRLFGNIFAGELLIGVLMTMFAVGVPIPIMMLSLLSGVIQAVVFGSLIASSLSGVIQED